MNNLFKDYKHNKDFLELIHYKLGYKLYIKGRSIEKMNYFCNKQ